MWRRRGWFRDASSPLKSPVSSTLTSCTSPRHLRLFLPYSLTLASLPHYFSCYWCVDDAPSFRLVNPDILSVFALAR
jgi:hypothetical protein